MGKAKLTRPSPQLEVLSDADALAHRVAEWMFGIVLKANGRVAVALAGGSTPRSTYELIGSAEYRDKFPWQRIHWFWGDERFVPLDNPRSNYRMAWEALLSRAPVPAENIHAVPVENATPECAAQAYEKSLKSFYGADRLDPSRPLFDITLLGLGEDGHLASLFPRTDALHETKRWVVSVTGAQPEPRITLTYPVLESSCHAGFLVAGAEKAHILRSLLAEDHALPASRFEPVGTLNVFADLAAASKLS